MRLVIVESPFRAKSEEDRRIFDAYVRDCLRDCLNRCEAPFAPHALYTLPGVLDDDDTIQRDRGIEAGLCWGIKADLTAVYVDHGISGGMRQGIARAIREGRPVELRSLRDLDTRPIAADLVKGFPPEEPPF